MTNMTEDQFWGNESRVLKYLSPTLLGLLLLYVKYVNTFFPSQVKRLFEPMATSVLLLRMSQTQQKQDENRELRGD